MRISLAVLAKIFLLLYISKAYNFATCTEADDLEVVEDVEVKDQEPETPKTLSEEELLDSADDSHVLTSEKLFQESSKSEKYEYQAEVTRLLDIIVNSLYSSKDIFLRELVSNSTDALEKYKITSFQKGYKDKDDVDLLIKIRSYPKKRLLTIYDNGVGMTKSELMTNLGTIAKSGTANFLDSLSKVGNDPNLIGQFGVGFYSAFLVADTVIVQTKHYEDKQYVWKSSAANSYELFEDAESSLGDHGTLITLELREDATEYLKTDVLEGLIKKYSQFVKYPIQLYKKLKDRNEVGWVNVNETQQIWTRNKSTISEEEYNEFYRSLTGKREDPLAHIHFTAEGDVDFKALLYIPSTPPSMYFSTEGVGHHVKLYSRRVLVSEDMHDFIPRYLFSVYGVVDSDSFPLNVSREYLQQSKLVRVIGKKVVRTVLDTLYDVMKKSEAAVAEVDEELEKVKALAAEADWNAYKKDWKKRNEAELKEFEEERTKDAEKKKTKATWEDDRTALAKKLERKTRQVDKYAKFYKGFKGSLKVGCYDDDHNRKKIAKLLKYKTLFSEKELTFDQYVDRMPEGQTEIYYVTSDNYEDLKQMPHLQGLRKRKFDVLYLHDTMDEGCLIKLEEHAGKKFKNVQKADVNLALTDEEKKEEERKETKYKPLLNYLKELFPETSGVKLSRRLVEDPCTVVAAEWSMSSHMLKLMKSYTVHRDESFDAFTKFNSKVLELNPDHPIMVKLLYLFTQAQNMDKPAAAPDAAAAEDKEVKALDEATRRELAEKKAKYMKRLDRHFKLLYNAAKLKSGFELEEPQMVVNYLYERVNRTLGEFVERDYDRTKDLKLDDFEVPKEEEAKPEEPAPEPKDAEPSAAAEAAAPEAAKPEETTEPATEEAEKVPEALDLARHAVSEEEYMDMTMMDHLKDEGIDMEKLRNKEEDYDWTNDEL